jgi:hypothetical protein
MDLMRSGNTHLNPKDWTVRARTIAAIAGIILSVWGFNPEAAMAQNSVKPIGKVLTTHGSVTVEHADAIVVQASLGSQPGQTKIGDPIYQGDIVATGADGKVGIAFADGTAFDLSSNARMAMTEFVYDPNGTSNATLLSLTKGTFTFVAGKIAKTGDMKIDTPVATMGIRGTTPHVEISDDGSVKFSTLVEEGRDKVTERQNRSVAPQAPSAIDRKPNLDICRRC